MRTFSSPQWKASTLEQALPNVPSLQPLATCFLSPPLDISYEWNHIYAVSYVLFLSSPCFLGSSTLFMHQCCVVFIHSSVDGHLGLFPTLDHCEQCFPELEQLVFPSKVLSSLNPAVIHMWLLSCYSGKVEEWCQKRYGLRYVLVDSLQKKFVGS